MMNILIIEDESHAADLLELRLKDLRECAIMAKIESVRSTLNWLYKTDEEPDLIFMDIELADGNSFEIFKHTQLNCPVIFTTAYDQYALDAFKVNALDYLLKPIQPDALENALKRFEGRSQNNASEISERIERMSEELMPKRKRNRCLVKKGGSYEFVHVKDIALAYSEDSITFLITTGGVRHIYTKTIEQLMAELDEEVFFQINRAQIVHVENVSRIHPYLGQRLKLEVNHKGPLEDVLVSRKRSKAFKAWLDA